MPIHTTMLIIISMTCAFIAISYASYLLGKYHERCAWNVLIEKNIIRKPLTYKQPRQTVFQIITQHFCK